MVIALIPQHARQMKPPRTLAVPFELGRPLGVPGDVELQLDVLRAALRLLVKTSDTPIFETYESDVATGDEGAGGWSCPVTFAPDPEGETSWASKVGREISLLRPWYEKSVRKREGTTVGLSGLEVGEIPEFLVQFLDSPGDERVPENLTCADALKFAAEDLKAFYNEAATVQPGQATAREIEHWYWNECDAGRLVREIRAGCSEHPDQSVRIVAGFTLVPHSQTGRED